MERGRRLANGAAAVILVAFLAALVDAAFSVSITYDEPASIGAAFHDARSGRVTYFLEYPPLARVLVGETLLALGVQEGEAARFAGAASEDRAKQWLYGGAIVTGNPRFSLLGCAPGPPSVTVAARLPLLVFPLLLALVAYVWARERFGCGGGLVALVAAVTWPDLLGHGALVKFDVPFAACSLTAAFALERLARSGGAFWLVTTGLALGATLAVRLSGPAIVLGLAAAAGVALLRRDDPAWPLDPAPATLAHPFGTGRRAWAASSAVLALVALALLVLRAAYRGANPIAAYSHALLEFGGYLREPALRAYEAAGFGPTFHWLYFPWILLVTQPVGHLALLGGGLGLTLRDARQAPARAALLWLPPLALCAATVALAPPFGSRLTIPFVAFGVVATGRVAVWAGGSRRRWIPIALALGASLAGAAREHPFHGTSANALAGDPRLTYQHAEDQDMGGGLAALARWQRQRGVASVNVVLFVADPYLIVPDPRGGPRKVVAFATPRLDLLAAYGVQGTLRRGDVLFAPTPGTYAVSAHVAARALTLAEGLAREQPFWPYAARRPVLGDTLLPLEVVGGEFLIFEVPRGQGSSALTPR